MGAQQAHVGKHFFIQHFLKFHFFVIKLSLSLSHVADCCLSCLLLWRKVGMKKKTFLHCNWCAKEASLRLGCCWCCYMRVFDSRPEKNKKMCAKTFFLSKVHRTQLWQKYAQHSCRLSWGFLGNTDNAFLRLPMRPQSALLHFDTFDIHFLILVNHALIKI